MASRNFPKVIVIGPGGGHLTEAMLATEGVPMRRTIATFCLLHTRETLSDEDLYCMVDPHGSIWKYLLNFFQSMWMLIKVRPKAVVSTGGGMTIATCLLGKMFGAKLIFIESGARVTTPSRTGKLMYRYADMFIVQWEPMLEHFPKAIYGGMLF